MGNIGPHCLIQHAGDDRAVGYCADYFLNYYAYFGIYFIGPRLFYGRRRARDLHAWKSKI